jgi:hypothetical protein
VLSARRHLSIKPEDEQASPTALAKLRAASVCDPSEAQSNRIFLKNKRNGFTYSRLRDRASRPSHNGRGEAALRPLSMRSTVRANKCDRAAGYVRQSWH